MQIPAVNNAGVIFDKNLSGRYAAVNGFTGEIYIDPDNGKVADVEFMFVTFNPYATIPVSVYRKIETEIKKNIWFTVTPEGKKQNYIMLFWPQEPK